MKSLLQAALLVGVVVGIGAIAVASGSTPPSAGYPNDCPRRSQPSGTLIAATPRAEAPASGPVDAPVVVEVWSDFQCPFCARGAERLKQLREKYGDKVRIVFRHSPLPFHEHARLAATASMAAHEQGKFWEYHDALFAQQQNLDRAALESLAKQLNLDLERFRRSLESNDWSSYLDLERAEAQRRGVTGTPTFFINDKALLGAQPLEAFTALVDEALKR